MPSEIIICTSTPSNFLEQMGEKYGVSVYVRQGESNIRDDWNFAWEKADGEFVTLAHQDDVYHRAYGEQLKKGGSRLAGYDGVHQRLCDCEGRQADFLG